MGAVIVLGVVGFAAYMFQNQIVSAAGGSLTADDIRQLATDAGFSGWDLETAVAIAFAESSGNPDSVGDLTLGVSIGLWQVNLKYHPEYTHQELLDPQTNANAAYAIYQAAGDQFTPWSTWKNQAYLKHLDENGTAVA